MGARSMAMANASSCLSDEWSIFNNIGGLSEVSELRAAFSLDMHPRIQAFNRKAFIFALPVKAGVAGIGAFRFGDDIYNEQIFSAGFSNQFGIASLGIKGNYIQYQAEGFGSRGVFTVSFGGIAKLTPNFSVGAYITNINQPSISIDKEEILPTLVTMGISINPSENFFLTSEIEKDLEREIIFKSALEYRFHKKFFFRTGFNLQPDAAFVGFGFKPRKIAVDYSTRYNPVLGFSHQATVAFQLKKK